MPPTATAATAAITPRRRGHGLGSRSSPWLRRSSSTCRTPGIGPISTDHDTLAPGPPPGANNQWPATKSGITLGTRSPREAAMDRSVLDVIERELDDEVRTRFPGAAVRHVALLQYGDDPQIEPRDLWVRVLLDSNGPEDYDRSWKAFADAHQAAIDEFPRYLTEKVREIMNVEFRFADGAGSGCDRDGPQWGYPTGRRLSDYQEWERGQATFVRAPLGPSGLETLDTLIMA